jgi:hypothetical protein
MYKYKHVVIDKPEEAPKQEENKDNDFLTKINTIQQEMGFNNRKAIMDALVRANYDTNLAVEILLDQSNEQ